MTVIFRSNILKIEACYDAWMAYQLLPVGPLAAKTQKRYWNMIGSPIGFRIEYDCSNIGKVLESYWQQKASLRSWC